MDVKEWLINWFEKNSDLNTEEIMRDLNEDYLAKGWIDSFQFITLVTKIEEDFRIRFSNDEFQNKEFATISGLTKIVESKSITKVN